MYTRPEVHSLFSAAKELSGTTLVFLNLDSIPSHPELPDPLQWHPAAAWLLGDVLDRSWKPPAEKMVE
jgi:hypothetical protein